MIVHNYGKIPESYIYDGNEKLRELNAKELDKIESLGVDEIWYWCIDFVESQSYNGGIGGWLLMRCGSDYAFWFFDLSDFGEYSLDKEDSIVDCIKFRDGRSLAALETLYSEGGSEEEVLPLVEMAYRVEKKKTRGKQTSIEEDLMNALIGD